MEPTKLPAVNAVYTGEVTSLAEQLERAASLANDLINSFEDKARPVLRQEPTKESTVDLPPAQTEIGGRLSSALNQVYGLQNRLRSLEERLEV